MEVRETTAERVNAVSAQTPNIGFDPARTMRNSESSVFDRPEHWNKAIGSHDSSEVQ